MLVGKRLAPLGPGLPLVGVWLALLISTLSILSIVFVIASMVPTARFAQPVGAAFLYPMIALSGIFVPVVALPPALNMVARCLPLTYTVFLLQGIWSGNPWSAHPGDLAALALVLAICTTRSARLFRRE